VRLKASGVDLNCRTLPKSTIGKAPLNSDLTALCTVDVIIIRPLL